MFYIEYTFVDSGTVKWQGTNEQTQYTVAD
jgi:hypothetical protein